METIKLYLFTFVHELKVVKWFRYNECFPYTQVNDIAFHPVHGTLATVGSDCKFSFWDKDARTKLKTSEGFDQPLTSCCFNPQGNVFCYATSYDWSKVIVLPSIKIAIFCQLKISTGGFLFFLIFF